MSEELWTVIRHVIPATHLRGFMRGVRNEQTDHLRLEIKQYIPKNQIPQSGDVTILTGQGVGQSKELFEPFLDDLLVHGDVPIRAVWAMDCVNHGASYLLNEKIIGDEHHWLDASRDLLQMVNYFQTHMPPPIYGVGLSWGTITLTMASVMHPRLFAGIVAIEAMFDTGYQHISWIHQGTQRDANHRAGLMVKRREFWPTRKEARDLMAVNSFFQSYDPRVFDKVIQYDLRDCPTPEHPHGVCLTTPKSMQLGTMMMPDPPFPGHPAPPEYVPGNNNVVVPGFFRGEVEQIQRSLPYVYSPVLYLWGKKSDIGMSDYAAQQVNATGTGKGGNGGVASGQVKSVYMEDAGHTLILEKPRETAEITGEWMRERHAARMKETEPGKKAPFNPGVVDPLWVERITKKSNIKL